MYAIVEISGKQYKVQEGDIVFVDRLEEYEEGAKVSFEKVLFISDGEKVTIGEDLIKGATVEASVVGHGKSKKIIVYKYKAKKNQRKTRGHRQPYTKIQIESIMTQAAKPKAEKVEKTEKVEKVKKVVEETKTETKKETKPKAETKAKE